VIAHRALDPFDLDALKPARKEAGQRFTLLQQAVVIVLRHNDDSGPATLCDGLGRSLGSFHHFAEVILGVADRPFMHVANIATLAIWRKRLPVSGGRTAARCR